MRRVALKDLNDQMILARPIYQGTNLILERDAKNLTKYVDKLKTMGIFWVYVNDAVSEDIEIPDAISESTREKCEDAVNKVFTKLRQQGNFIASDLDAAVEALIKDILSQPDILSSLQYLSAINDDTIVHCVNTAVYSILIGTKENLAKEDLLLLAKGAILHDIGKVDLNESILHKPSSLTQDEFTHVKEHCTFGYTLLVKNGELASVSCKIALEHHERLDGSGYPNGLKGDEIHPFSRMVAVADMYDAITSVRAYRTNLSNLEAYQILSSDAEAGKLDAKYVSALFDHVAVYPNGITVHLSNGARGIVKSQNPGWPFRPLVRVINDAQGYLSVCLYDLNLSEHPEIEIIEN